MEDEFKRRKKQLEDLCHAVKAESVADLHDILCCMVLSECVYKVNLISFTRMFTFGLRILITNLF